MDVFCINKYLHSCSNYAVKYGNRGTKSIKSISLFDFFQVAESLLANKSFPNEFDTFITKELTIHVYVVKVPNKLEYGLKNIFFINIKFNAM